MTMLCRSGFTPSGECRQLNCYYTRSRSRMCDEEICRVDSLRHDSRSEDDRTDLERSYQGIALGGHGQSHQFRFGQVLREVCRCAVRINVEIENIDDGASFV